ncbi:hypothetical protein ACQ4PT_022016 [Festuca glaucescens]
MYVQVDVKPSSGSMVEIELVATNTGSNLALHWGALQPGRSEWVVPPAGIRLPEGTIRTPDDAALRTPFKNSGSNSTLKIEIDNQGLESIEFVIVDEAQNKWFKNNGQNFQVHMRPPAGHHHQGQQHSATAGSIGRKNRDVMQLLSKNASTNDQVNKAAEATPSKCTVLDLFIKSLQEKHGSQVLCKKVFKLGEKEILAPPPGIVPAGSTLLEIACESPFSDAELNGLHYQVLEIELDDDSYKGMPFVLRSNQTWIKNSTSDFYLDFSRRTAKSSEALMDYMNSDLDIKVYWDTLNKNGITKERLLSYDHPIHSEPNLKSEQKEGLLHDLTNYMRSLKAVHSGADLESAIGTCTGYTSESQGFMVGVEVNPVKGLPSGFPELLKFVLDHIEDKSVESLVEGLLEARAALRPLLLSSTERLKDLIFLDIALDSTVRTAIERSFENLNNASSEKIMYFISLVVENLALSTDDNENLLCCLKGWNHALEMSKHSDDQWALYAKAFLDRTRLALATKGEEYHDILQPSAEYLGSLLGIEQWTVNIFTEEIIRSGSAASLSLLLNRLDPVLRNVANLGSWQIISPVDVAGYVVVVDQLLTVQHKSYDKPTILVVEGVKGEEEIPDGVVAVLTPDMPDVLSHVSVRARNSKVLFATCFDPKILSELEQNEGKVLSLKPASVDISYREIPESELLVSSSIDTVDGQKAPSLSLAKKQFLGKYAISAEEFSDEMVGAKSRNIAYLNGKVPSWVSVPTSVALPFGTFETVLSDKINKEVSQKVKILTEKLDQGELGALSEIRNVLLNLTAPTYLVSELKEKMQSSGMPWPGDEGEQRWEQAWTAIKKVLASKWNERAYLSTRKVKLDHSNLSMAVLVQQIVSADYAFVIHTTNPSSGERSEIYAEVVKGLGETLVGAYPGRAMSFVCSKNNLESPKVLGYPSKPIGLFIQKSIIFRSDSNGEDLEGYAGAGLYDSVPMDKEEQVVLDYTTDPLVTDCSFRTSTLSSIARAGYDIEQLYGGSPQDIEGVVKDGKIYIVQTRPQM